MRIIHLVSPVKTECWRAKLEHLKESLSEQGTDYEVNEPNLGCTGKLYATADIAPSDLCSQIVVVTRS